MNDAQVDKLLEELAETRKSFDSAAKSIRWNKINTAILYFLMILVFIFGGIGVANYMNYREDSCERSNEFITTVTEGMEHNAFAIGAALAVVFNAPQERLEQYLDAYNAQRPTEAFHLREC